MDNSDNIWSRVGWQNIVSVSDASGDYLFYRDHDHTRLTFRAFGIDGASSQSEPLENSYQASFEIVESKLLCTWVEDYDHCGSYGNEGWCGTCHSTKGAHFNTGFRWKGKHIKKISSPDCPEISTILLDPENYAEQDGKVREILNMGNKLDQTRRCTLNAYTSDGTRVGAYIRKVIDASMTFVGDCTSTDEGWNLSPFTGSITTSDTPCSAVEW
jgi:hypothetical protein